MPDATLELPLAFDGHHARMVVTHRRDGAWRVCTEVDGRVLGWEQFARWVQVERFRSRMQGWISQVEAAERQFTTAA
jgi:hypothetical protein